MRFIVSEIHEPERKSKYTETILRNLPEWFGNENSAYFGQFDHLIRFMPIARYA